MPLVLEMSLVCTREWIVADLQLMQAKVRSEVPRAVDDAVAARRHWIEHEQLHGYAPQKLNCPPTRAGTLDKRSFEGLLT